MTTLSARFIQSPAENLRYVLDYTKFMAPGEGLSSLISNVTQLQGVSVPAFSINSVAIIAGVSGSAPLLAAFFASGGVNQGVYEVQFLATTSLGQILEDVIEYTLIEKV